MDRPSVDGIKGYSLPLSPSGSSSMISAPPWHFSGDAVWVTYRADPDHLAAFLPPGLTPGADPGAAAIGFYDWQWCSADGAELRDPGQAQFRECLIVLACELDRRPAGRVPYAWVDSAVSLVRGHIQGMPKLPGSVCLTRSFPVGRAAPRREPGAEFSAVASAGGRTIASATVTLAGPQQAPPPLADRPLVHTRHFPAWEPGETPLQELVTAAITDAEFADIWHGRAELRFDASGPPELAALAPVETGSGYIFSYAETLAPGRRVADRPEPT
jgi:enduracididine biosynthesis enzyme MppR